MTARDQLLHAAEVRARVGGYNGFSFRDIARDTGLTNAGVHHHFPTKADLVTHLAKAYTQRFLEALNACPPARRVTTLRHLFSDSLRRDGKMCLCGLLAAESGALPDPVHRAALGFFDSLRDSLAQTFAHSVDPSSAALQVLSQLEGAAMIATLYGDFAIFDQATKDLVNPS